MIFNSYIFIFFFLPVSLLGFYFLSNRFRPEVKFFWLVAASLFFYGWWNGSYIIIILASIFVNYFIGTMLSSDPKKKVGKVILIFGVGLNLALLSYYKYASFFVDAINQFLTLNLQVNNIVLPLAISFFTFQQIAYLVDAYRGEVKDYDFIHYCLFVTFFPQLIAGPIVHHKEMLPQFIKGGNKVRHENIAVGLTIFTIGLFKKTVLADGVSQFVGPVFTSAESVGVISTFDAWAGALAYTFQLYFDFSGYSDMAVGLARLFGITLPINFNSPYKALSIIDFWKRWHITLSHFLRDYLYFPLGGNKLGHKRRYLNLMITMLLGGLWHGAGWTFIAWGALHGLALSINHFWHGLKIKDDSKLYKMVSWLLTFLVVLVFWVFFKAESISGALNILYAMSGLGESIERTVSTGCVSWFSVLTIICLWGPNTYQIMSRYNPVLPYEGLGDNPIDNRIVWRPSGYWAALVSIMAFWSVCTLGSVSEFLYFQF